MHKSLKNLAPTSKPLGARRVTESKSYTEDPQIRHTTVKYLVRMVAWHVGYVYSCANTLKCADNYMNKEPGILNTYINDICIILTATIIKQTNINESQMQ
jgi:hypothetical protein